ncbi:hypothetical protein RN333_03015 [Enterobacter kobei]|uniref:hypothetical protein n=1 Tax=Enterobacter kobei TaxID=208224 RepID=UPI0028D168C5|nr:hypothetical protein [Enterobacter kobei]WNP35227.1 hypothetical protein RN333_03015 [Enterobacter kobei]
MSKKQKKTRSAPVEVQFQQTDAAHLRLSFGYDEMLSELEAIVADAEVRLSDEEAA